MRASFDRKEAKCIEPVAMVYAYYLTPNHVYFLTWTKSEEDLPHLSGFQNLTGVVQEQSTSRPVVANFTTAESCAQHQSIPSIHQLISIKLATDRKTRYIYRLKPIYYGIQV